jgi:diguanylate cyclase (GGDEF)-like protein
MRRSVGFALAGALASAGAPLGLLGVRLRQRPPGRPLSRRAVREELAADRASYAYVGMSTAIAFTVFGWMAGRQADRLAALSETDPLTELANARAFFDRLDKEVARSQRYRDPLALLLVDLDRLKAINDGHGHAAGDDAIRRVARIIRSELRRTDFGARWGGDEFAVVAPNTSRAAALALAGRIRAVIEDQEAPWPMSVSIGVATMEPAAQDEAGDLFMLMRAADAALYEAKRRGRNAVVMADPRSPARRSPPA